MNITVPEIGQLETFNIRTYEIDEQKIATVPSVIKLMHEAAMQNVLRIKLSVWDLEPHQISWVLMRKYLKIERLPKLGETIHVLTHPAGFEKFFTYRDYRIFDEKGEMIVHSSSTWLLMDTVKRRMSRIPDFILDLNKIMPSQEACLPRPRIKLPKLEQVDHSKTFQIGWFDLDFNGHLNNVFYTQWMLEAIDGNFLKEKELKDFQIEYRIEGRYGEKINSDIQVLDDNKLLHRLIRAEDQKELAIALTTWE